MSYSSNRDDLVRHMCRISKRDGWSLDPACYENFTDEELCEAGFLQCRQRIQELISEHKVYPLRLIRIDVKRRIKECIEDWSPSCTSTFSWYYDLKEECIENEDAEVCAMEYGLESAYSLLHFHLSGMSERDAIHKLASEACAGSSSIYQKVAPCLISSRVFELEAYGGVRDIENPKVAAFMLFTGRYSHSVSSDLLKLWPPEEVIRFVRCRLFPNEFEKTDCAQDFSRTLLATTSSDELMRIAESCFREKTFCPNVLLALHERELPAKEGLVRIVSDELIDNCYHSSEILPHECLFGIELYQKTRNELFRVFQSADDLVCDTLKGGLYPPSTDSHFQFWNEINEHCSQDRPNSANRLVLEQIRSQYDQQLEEDCKESQVSAFSYPDAETDSYFLAADPTYFFPVVYQVGSPEKQRQSSIREAKRKGYLLVSEEKKPITKYCERVRERLEFAMRKQHVRLFRAFPK